MTSEHWKKVEPLFHQANALAKSEQNAFLLKYCPDETVRQSVVALLKNAELTGEISQMIDSAADSYLFKISDLSDQRLGAYRLISQIGEGGMGSVYLAERDDEQYNKKVAIKLIHRFNAQDEHKLRFQIERQILATLEHPNIAHLIDGGTTETGLPYLVMDYIEGKPIDEYSNQQRLSVPQRLTLFLQVCAAVQFAHQKLIVHRDLKPSNLLVNQQGNVYLLDFGIAKLLDQKTVDNVLLETQIEQRLLTPLYASPEQIKGEPVSTASDIYALGALLYRLLVGTLPYQLANTTRYSVEQAILTQEPLRPSEAVKAVLSIKTKCYLKGLAMPVDSAERYTATWIILF